MRIKDKIKGPPTYTLSRELSDEEVKAFNPWNLAARLPCPTAPSTIGTQPTSAREV